jgi:hypothetical protein
VYTKNIQLQDIESAFVDVLQTIEDLFLGIIQVLSCGGNDWQLRILEQMASEMKANAAGCRTD